MDQVRIGRYIDLQEAQIAAGMLQAQGFAVHLQNEQLGAVDFLVRQAIGGFGIWVPEDEAEDAKAVLDEAAARAADFEPDPEIAARPRRLSVRILGYVVYAGLGLAALSMLFAIGSFLYRGFFGSD
ncbi:hypothetical protein QO010_004008 [Caulobacter ginsengisoli]|uniref:DUF2007 domain-containing protein n=1 Tax=Caulobacter ginsengisoli TaxID=400775 RepID=A0ABU0IXX2_9CAUL|nr:hypothetical protein [Caulobacter ginsengisoli]MDQ0466215.1 hypothetical protein [Caulobacter ginsengisoli]